MKLSYPPSNAKYCPSLILSSLVSNRKKIKISSGKELVTTRNIYFSIMELVKVIEAQIRKYRLIANSSKRPMLEENRNEYTNVNYQKRCAGNSVHYN